METDWFGNNRMACDVLEDMRKCQKTHNYSMLSGLICELQIMANRMEAALQDQRDLTSLTKKISVLKKELKQFESEKQELKPETNKKEDR